MRRAAIVIGLLGALAIVAFAQPTSQEQSSPEPADESARPAAAAAPSRVPAFAPAHSLAAPSLSLGILPSDDRSDEPSLVEPIQAVRRETPAGAIAGTPEITQETKIDAKPSGPPQPGAAPVAAKALFGAATTPAPLAARAIGFYARGCLAGAVPVPIDGETWQVMRLSRNRNWGHPRLVKLVERLAEDGAGKDGWPGLLVGDISQPRGGPMLTGHSSHQIGLDADVWLTPMPERRLTEEEREKLAATSMLGKDGIHVDPEIFSPHHAAIIRRAASYPEVERVLVHPGIKKAMCLEKGADRSNFHKIRPYWGHHYHMHIRMACPPGNTGCRPQVATAGDDGCGAEIDGWIARLKKPPKPEPPSGKPTPPPRPVTLDDLPGECRAVIAAGAGGPEKAAAGTDKMQRSAGHR